MLFKRLVIAFASFLVFATAAQAQTSKGLIQLYKPIDCSCCQHWAEAMERAGFAVEVRNVERPLLAHLNDSAGIPKSAISCHIARVGGYFIEGHVPAGDIEKLLAEKPDAVGLSAPGMPESAPGMETKEGVPYDVLLIKHDGSTSLFAHHS
jgi:hypothetical protein